MPLPSQSTVAWQVCISLLQVGAIGSTFIRLGHRWHIQKMWWDDWVVTIPLVADILYFTTMWLHFKSQLKGHLFVSFWFNNILFLFIVWVSRITLSLSFARIFPPNHNCRRFGFGLASAFFVLCIATVLMSALDCYDKSTPQWYNVPLRLCVARRKSVLGGIYLSIAFDYVADILLVLSPLTMLWKVQLPRQQRRMLHVLFSSSIFSLLASVFFSSVGLTPIAKLGPSAFLLLGMGAQLQAAVTLFVCNIVVVATFFYVISQRQRDDESLNDKSIPDANAKQPTPAQQGSPVIAGHTSVIRSFFGKRDTIPGTRNKIDEVDSSASSHSTLELTSLYEDSTGPSGGEESVATSRSNSHSPNARPQNATQSSKSPRMIDIEIDSVEMEMAFINSQQESGGPVWSFSSSGQGESAAPAMLSLTTSDVSQSSSSQMQSSRSEVRTQSSQSQSQSQSSGSWSQSRSASQTDSSSSSP